jgi:hypothetical protein
MTYSLYGSNANAEDAPANNVSTEQSAAETPASAGGTDAAAEESAAPAAEPAADPAAGEEANSGDTAGSAESKTAAPAAVGNEAAVSLSAMAAANYSFSISGPDAVTIETETTYPFLSGMTWTPSDSHDWASGDEFRLAVTGVDTPSGGSYTFSAGDTEFTPSVRDDGRVYTIHFEIQKKDSNGSWKSLDTPCTAEKKVTVSDDDVLGYNDPRDVYDTGNTGTNPQPGYTDLYEGGGQIYFPGRGNGWLSFIIPGTSGYVYHQNGTVSDPNIESYNCKYFAILSNFGYPIADPIHGDYYRINDPASWPENLRNGLIFNKITSDSYDLQYTYSADDLAWAMNNPGQYHIRICPVADIHKIDKDAKNPETGNYLEAYQMYSATMEANLLQNGNPYGSVSGSYYHSTDKRTVKIESQIAAVTDGKVGNYSNDTVYLNPAQEGSVKVTLTRPAGLFASGSCSLTSTIPGGMTYVPGSAKLESTAADGATVDDTGGNPVVKFDSLAIGGTVTLTYRVKAPDSVWSYTEFKTRDTLVNIWQKELTGRIHNSLFPSAAVYTVDEYTSTRRNIFAVRGTAPVVSSGSITVTKNVMTREGKTADISGTFYFTLFSDPECTRAVSKPQAVTVIHGASASTSFAGMAQGTYYAAETNSDGTKVITMPENTDTYNGSGVEGNGTKVTISTGSLTGSAVITNIYTAAGGKTPTKPSKPAKPSKPGTPAVTPAESPQTGDGFNSGLWFMLLLIGAAGTVSGFVCRRKKNTEKK